LELTIEDKFKMKKLFLALSVFVLVCGAKALADFPGWNSEDVSAFLA